MDQSIRSTQETLTQLIKVAKTFENAADLVLQQSESAKKFALAAKPEDMTQMDLIEQNMGLFTNVKFDNEEQAITAANLQNIMTLQTIELIASIMVRVFPDEKMAVLIPADLRNEQNISNFANYGAPSLAKICSL